MGRSQPTPPSSVEGSPSESRGIRMLLQNTSLNDRSSNEFLGFIRSSENTLARLRALPSGSKLLLFTPVVPPPSSSLGSARRNDRANLPMDPFEPLGLAISRYHKQVEHVPYVPERGMTETHFGFLQRAAALILVVRDGEQSHLSFAREMLDELLQSRDTRPFLPRTALLNGGSRNSSSSLLPPALMLVVADGSQPSGRNLPHSLDAFDTVLGSSSYALPALHQIAEYVFKT